MPHAPNQKQDSDQRSQRDRRASELAELGAMAPLYAHEIHNIITMLSGRAQLAQMRLDDQELIEQVLNGVVEACDRAARLSELFLNQHRQDTLDHEHLELPALCERVQRTFANQPTNSTPIELSVDSTGLTPDAPPIVIEQVLDNLVRNALRAIDEHPSPSDDSHRVTIRDESDPHCSTWNNASHQIMMRIVVEDTGVGMTQSEADALFAPKDNQSAEHRSPGPRNERFPRHGLGLRVCRMLIESVGGSIECESKPNKGTRMILRLPAIDRESSGYKAAA